MSGRGAKRALVWEGEPGDERVFTYAELQREVSRAANALRALGVTRQTLDRWIKAYQEGQGA